MNKHHLLLASTLLITSATSLGCADEERVTTSTITAASGGDIAFDEASLHVPAQALEADTDIALRFEAASNFPTADGGVIGDIITISPTATMLLVPASLSVELDPQAPARTSIYQFVDDTWVELVSARSSGVVVASISRFGSYAAVAAPVEGESAIVGTLSWPDGSPVANAALQLTQGGSDVATTTTNAAGGFVFADLAAGRYHVTSTLECALDEVIEVTAGQQATLNATLCGAG